MTRLSGFPQRRIAPPRRLSEPYATDGVTAPSGREDFLSGRGPLGEPLHSRPRQPNTATSPPSANGMTPSVIPPDE